MPHFSVQRLTAAALAVTLAACSKSKQDEPSAASPEAASPTADTLPETVTFNAHIRPIFSDTCFSCHGFDAKTREAGLRLDTAEGAYAALKESATDQRAIVPGDPDHSAAWTRIVSNDPEMLMPPPKFHKPLSDHQKQLIKRWIQQGAKYEKHWAYMPLAPADPPTLEKHAEQVTNPIDAFILARLEQDGIEPTPLADRATLLRRLSLDLTGLPPTPDEVRGFVSDNSPDAYEQQVDRLLASPRYGERMAVQWLDVVRFADTVGLHGDQYQNIFPYRDYVIDAFNSNMPFDQFTTEQLAGDLLENPTDQQLIATGFVRLSQMTREGGAQPKEYLAKYASDRVRSIGAAWLGQTTGCAECHDHKFDPISAKDFYSLSAFFKDVKEWGVYTHYGSSPNQDLMGFNNESPFPPEILIESPSYLKRIHWLQNKAYREHAGYGEIDEDWIQASRTLLDQNPDGWTVAKVNQVQTTLNTPHQTLDDSSLLLTGPATGDLLEVQRTRNKKAKDQVAPKTNETVTLTVSPASGPATTIRVELLPHEANDGHLGRAQDGLFSLIQPTFTLISNGKASPIETEWEQADHYYIAGNSFNQGFRPLRMPSLWKTGKFRFTLPEDIAKHPHTAQFIPKSPLTIEPGDRLEVTLPSDDIGRVRISTTRFPEPSVGQPALTPELSAAILADDDQRTAEQAALIKGAWALTHLHETELASDWPSLRQSIREGRGGITRSLIVMSIPEEEIPVTRVLPRGDWQNETGEIVEPAVPAFLPQPEATGDRRLTRLDLAKWLVNDDNPLTARHTMNRLWKQFFGKGLSNVLDDLGSQGEWPSHPQLLDWLATTFRDNGWDTKHMVKLMVMSHTYRQQAAVRDDLSDIDPYNRLLAQQSARRLDAEFIRDNALTISGLIETDYLGGPSVYPYQPPGYYAPLQFPDRKYITDTTGGQYRRSVYMHWQRTFLHPMLANFDAPSREECAADRLQANTPLQALTLLNDPAAVDMARHFALQLIEQAPTASARIDAAWKRALARSPNERELTSILDFLTAQTEHYTANPEDAAALLGDTTLPNGTTASEAAAWTQTCRALLNLHEVITRY